METAAPGLPEGWKLQIGDTLVDWDGDVRSVRLRVEDVGFVNARAQRVVTIPDATFSIHGDALLKGRIEPREVSATGINLLLTRDKDNDWSLGMGVPQGRQSDDGEAAVMQRSLPDLAADLFGRGDADQGTGVLGRLNQLLLKEATITVVDNVRNHVYAFLDSDLDLRGTEAGIDIRSETTFQTGVLSLPIRLSMVYRPETETVRGAVRFAQLSPPDLVQALGAPQVFTGLEFPVSGSVGFHVSAAEGFGMVPLKLDFGRGTFDLPGQLAGPLPIVSASLTGTLNPASRHLEIGELNYSSGTFRAEAVGSASLEPEGPLVLLDIVGTDVPLTLVPAYWPPARGRNVRDWLVGHIRGGVAGTVNARLNLTPDQWDKEVPGADAFEVVFDFTDADVLLYPPFDGVRAGAGRLRVNGRTMKIDLDSGQISDLAVSEGSVTIDDFSKDAPLLSAEFVATSTVQGATGSILRGPLQDAVPDRDVLAAIDGDVAARIALSIPVASNTQIEDTRFAANANLANVTLPASLAGLPMASDSLNLKVDSNGVELQGVVRTGQSALDIQWVERFGAGVPFFRQVAFSGTVDSADLLTLSEDVGQYLAGPAFVQGALYSHQDGRIILDIDADLTNAASQIEALRWYKPVATPASLKFQAVRAPSGAVELTELQLSSEELNVQGDVNLNADQQLESARLERADLGLNRLSFVVRRHESGQMAAQVVGDVLDLRPWLDQATGEKASMLTNGSTISIAVNQMILDDTLVLHDAVADLTHQDPYPTGELRGLLNNQAGVTATTAVSETGWQFALRSGDAGAVFNALGINDTIQGGVIQITGTLAPDSSVVGLATIDDFALSETPTFARLFSLASFTGIGEALSGEGLSFTRAELPFKYADGRIDFRKGRMAGPSVGLTADGYYIFDTREIRAVGNLIPAYSLSQVLGAIPLLGTVLGGDQGLFGVTYAVEGTADKPVVTVNPLSALAPGILRHMFLEPVEPQAFDSTEIERIRDER